MFCSKCGKKIEIETSFCSICGNKISLNGELDKTKKDLELSNTLSSIDSSLVNFTAEKFDRLEQTFLDMDTLLGDYDAFVRDNCYVYGSITNQYSALTNRYNSITGQHLQIKQEIDNLINKINEPDNANNIIY